MATLVHGWMSGLTRRLRRGPAGRPAPGRAVAGGLATTLLLAGLAFAAGKGVVAASYRTHASNAWLGTTPRGSITLVDGITGRPSAEIMLPGTAGHRLQISQDGDYVLVYDPSTGVLTKINSGGLTAGPARATIPGVRLVAGPKAAYLIDYGAGTVQRIDIATLQNIGAAVRVPGRLGTAGVDAQGTVWIPRSDDGMVIPVTQAGAGTPVDVGGRGSSLAVSIVGGGPVVVDATKGRVSVVTGTGVAWSATLPGVAGGSALLAPATQDKNRFPLVDAAGGRLFVVDVAAHDVRSVPVGAGDARPQLGPPVVHGDDVYLPDQHSGSVLVYSMKDGTWEPSFPVGGSPGQIDTVTRDDAVYFNDTQGSHAVVVGGDGTPRPVEKYRPGRPGAKTAPSSPPLPGGVPGGRVPPPAGAPSVPVSVPGGGVSGTPPLGHGHGRKRRVTPPPVPPPGGTPSPIVPPPGGTPSATPPGGVPPTPSTGPPPGGTPTPSPTPTPPSPSAPPPPGTPRNVAATSQPGGSIKVSWSPPPGAPKDIGYTVTYGGGGTSGSVQTTSTTLTIDAARLTFLGTYTFKVGASDSGGKSGTASARARSGGDGKSFTVDVSKTRTDPQNPCLPANLPNCRATMRQQPTHTSAQTGIARQGTTVTGFCHKSGQTIRNDDGAISTEWILIDNGSRGYVSTLWLGGPGAYQSLWPCP